MVGGGPVSWAEMDALEDAEELTEAYYDMNTKMGMMAHNIMRSPMVEDKAAALADLATGYAERVKGMATDGTNKETVPDGLIDKLKSWLGIKEEDDEKATWTTAFVNNLPDSSFLYIEDGGEKDGEGKTKPRSLRHLPYKDTAGKVDLPHLRNAIARIPQMKGVSADKKTQLQNRARKLLESANKEETKSLYIWKENGTYHWLAAYSNNRRDNDSPPEIISTDSHKEFDQALQQNKWPMPELWLWHIPYPVGTTQYHAFDESTGFPVAAGTFYKGMEWAAEGILDKGWDGVSHGMPSAWIKRDDKDKSIIVQHRTKEITFLPLWAAANKLTFSIIKKESSMSDDEKGLPAHKRDEFVKAFGEERVKQIEAALAEKSKEADEAGIEKKESELTPDSEIVKALEIVMTEITSLRQDVDTRLKAIEEKTEEKEEPFDLITFLKSKSAVGKEENKVDGRSRLGKDAPEETEGDTPTRAGLGVPVSLVDSLIQANQKWYEGGK